MMHEEYHENQESKIIAYRVSDNKKVFAFDVTKSDGPFYCPETFEELIVRKCTEKIDHFAYKFRRSPISIKNKELHDKCQNELLKCLLKAFPDGKWEKERSTIKTNEEKGLKKVIPDLSGRIQGKPLVIEIQKSSLSVEMIKHRTEQYSKRGIFILWIVPLKETLGEKDFRPRLFERFLHTMYYGRVYYWIENQKTKLIPVHFDDSERWIKESSWYNENGEEQTAGGYYKTYLRLKSPNYGEQVDLLTDFNFIDREKFILKNENLSSPKCKICLDNLSKWWK